VIEPGQWSHARLIEQLRRLHEDHLGMVKLFSAPPSNLPNPWAAVAGASLAAQSASLAEAVLGTTELDDGLIACAVNQLYESRNVMVYLIEAARTAPRPFPKPPTKLPSPSTDPPDHVGKGSLPRPGSTLS
jgi:hypothetical protein